MKIFIFFLAISALFYFLVLSPTNEKNSQSLNQDNFHSDITIHSQNTIPINNTNLTDSDKQASESEEKPTLAKRTDKLDGSLSTSGKKTEGESQLNKFTVSAMEKEIKGFLRNELNLSEQEIHSVLDIQSKVESFIFSHFGEKIVTNPGALTDRTDPVVRQLRSDYLSELSQHMSKAKALKFLENYFE